MTKEEVIKQVDSAIHHQAEEQVIFLKNNYKMKPVDIISLYGGQPYGDESYRDAVERIAVFNMQNAAKNGFVA